MSLNKKVRKLEDKINGLKTTIEFLNNKNIQNLNAQKNTFQQIIYEKNEKIKKKDEEVKKN